MAPISISAPHLRVCVNASPPNVPAIPVAGSGDHAATSQPAVVPGPDIGPELDQRFADLDAEILALQGYIQSCQAAGRCAAGVTPP